MRAAVPAVVEPRSRFWRTGPRLDQGRTPECVGYAWKNFRDASPVMDAVATPPSADEIYNAAQKIDEWAGTKHDGTSVRAGAKVLAAEGLISEYVWADDAAMARDYVVSRGPVVFGTNWYDDMFETDAKGFLHVGGDLAGGHAYLVNGFSIKRNAFEGFMAWGEWGLRKKGRFWLAFADADRLIHEQGEVCSALEVRSK